MSGIADDLQGLARRLVEPLRAWLIPWSAYEEGSWAPEYSGGTTPGATTYAANGQVGAYVRVGNRVDYALRVEWTAATGMGEARVSLPFTARNTTNLAYSAAVTPDGVTYTQDTITGLIRPNTNNVAFRSPISNAASAVVQVDASGGTLVVSGWFLL